MLFTNNTCEPFSIPNSFSTFIIFATTGGPEVFPIAIFSKALETSWAAILHIGPSFVSHVVSWSQSFSSFSSFSIIGLPHIRYLFTISNNLTLSIFFQAACPYNILSLLGHLFCYSEHISFPLLSFHFICKLHSLWFLCLCYCPPGVMLCYSVQFPIALLCQLHSATHSS